jgi:hypothetical protein
MNSMFMPEVDKVVVVFIDDILVYSKSMEEHQEYLRVMLPRLQDHQLYAKFIKLEFWIDEVPFFGHVISPDGIMMGPSKGRDVLGLYIKYVVFLGLLGIINGSLRTSPRSQSQSPSS